MFVLKKIVKHRIQQQQPTKTEFSYRPPESNTQNKLGRHADQRILTILRGTLLHFVSPAEPSLIPALLESFPAPVHVSKKKKVKQKKGEQKKM